MKAFVADAHSLLWHLFSPAKLGQAARQALAEVDEGKGTIFIPAVVVAELLMVAEKRWLPGVTTENLLTALAEFQASENYQLCPLMPDTVIKSRDLLTIPDIFDRLIAAEAIERDLPLLTCDPVIHASGLVSVIWT